MVVVEVRRKQLGSLVSSGWCDGRSCRLPRMRSNYFLSHDDAFKQFRRLVCREAVVSRSNRSSLNVKFSLLISTMPAVCQPAVTTQLNKQHRQKRTAVASLKLKRLSGCTIYLLFATPRRASVDCHSATLRALMTCYGSKPWG
jgi:hypothetical protein